MEKIFPNLFRLPLARAPDASLDLPHSCAATAPRFGENGGKFHKDIHLSLSLSILFRLIFASFPYTFCRHHLPERTIYIDSFNCAAPSGSRAIVRRPFSSRATIDVGLRSRKKRQISKPSNAGTAHAVRS